MPTLSHKIQQIQTILDDFKAQDIAIIEVPDAGFEVRCVIVATATSAVHGKSMAKHLKSEARVNKLDFLGIEGEDGGNWALVDLDDVVVHIMTADMRQYYQLEDLWGNINNKSDLKASLSDAQSS